jgi:prepilin signal peptidase PulO-like enzyme (type II secretory pathway)
MVLPSRILYPTLVVAIIGRLGYILFCADSKLHKLVLLVFSLLVASGFFWLLFYVSSGRWIGFGDVRLGLITGTLLATPAKSLLMLFLASLLGTLFVLPAMVTGRSKMTSRIPYGPFLIIATSAVLLFGQPFITWYQNHLL